MTTPAVQYPFDTRPLTDPVDRHEVARFSRELRAAYPTPKSQIVIWVIVGVVAVIVFVPMIAIALIALVMVSSTGSGGGGGAVFSLPMLIPLGIAAVVIPLIVAATRRGRIKAYRIARFAEANGMSYKHSVTNPPLPGMIFQQGHSRVARSLVRGQHPRFVEFGNYQYTTGSGKDSSTHHWGYIAVKLDVPLPNIVLDALGNNALGTNLPAAFSKDQRLSLEGDFDRYFALYCPRGYETDALYLFTPDIMARFIDHAAQLDVEIVDDWMFLYLKNRPAATTDAATWAWLFGTVGALMTKFDQWARWRDERLRATQAAAAPADARSVPAGTAAAFAATTPALPFAPPAGMLAPPPGVALEGRRLKKSVNWVMIAIIGIMVLFTLVPQFLGVIGALFLR